MNAPKEIGGISLIDIGLTSPLPIKYNGELQALTIYTGMNGTGKSFVMKTVWGLTYIANLFVANGRQGLEQICQEVFDKTLPEHNMTGTMRAHFKGNPVLTIAWQDGKFLSGRCDYTENITEISTPIYMSGSFRTFTAINYYLDFRSKIFSQFSDEHERMENMCAVYKLYDVITLEKMIARMPIAVSKDLGEALDRFDIRKDFLWPKDATEFNFDESGVYITNGKEVSHLHRFGNGHQSIINMMINSVI